MSWSIRLGRVLGIDIKVHLTFFLLLAYIVAINYLQSRDWNIALRELLFVTIVFAIIVMHEYGHALMARRFGVRTQDITLLPIGGVARLERIPENPQQELAIAIAGPAVNVALAVLCWLIMAARGEELSLSVIVNPFAGISLAQRLLAINIWLVVFNMIPAFPMDGGRVLRSLLAMVVDRVRATRTAATVGQMVALAFGFIGLFGNPMLIFIALFVWIGAAQEASDVETRSILSGIPVRLAMIAEFHAVGPLDTLADVARLVLAGFQQDFPVVDGGKVVGILTRRDLMEGLAASGHEAPVHKAMHTEFATATPGEMLTEVFPRLQASRSHSLPVLEDGRLVGLLTTENVSELLMIRTAIQQAAQS